MASFFVGKILGCLVSVFALNWSPTPCFIVSSGQGTLQQVVNIAGKLPQDRNPLDLWQLSEVLNRYEEEMANADLRKQAWKNCIEACVIRKIIGESTSAEQGTHSDSFQ